MLDKSEKINDILALWNITRSDQTIIRMWEARDAKTLMGGGGIPPSPRRVGTLVASGGMFCELRSRMGVLISWEDGGVMADDGRPRVCGLKLWRFNRRSERCRGLLHLVMAGGWWPPGDFLDSLIIVIMWLYVFLKSDAVWSIYLRALFFHSDNRNQWKPWFKQCFCLILTVKDF